MNADILYFALARGRVFRRITPLLKKAGLFPEDFSEDSRQLLWDSPLAGVKFFITRAADVPVFVRHGAACLGITGKDHLVEAGSTDIYELLDLKVACCTLATIGYPGMSLPSGRLRVASKYPNISRHHYLAQGIQADMIKLAGGIETALITGMADEIVDIIDTGQTLSANGLEKRQEILTLSARLIANRALARLKHQQVQSLVKRLQDVIPATNAKENND